MNTKLLDALKNSRYDLHCVQSSLIMPHLNLHTQDYNFDKDITTTNFLIQLHLSFAQIHNDQGNYETIILKDQYGYGKDILHIQPLTYIPPHPQHKTLPQRSSY
jgi:hypothetical protein